MARGGGGTLSGVGTVFKTMCGRLILCLITIWGHTVVAKWRLRHDVCFETKSRGLKWHHVRRGVEKRKMGHWTILLEVKAVSRSQLYFFSENCCKVSCTGFSYAQYRWSRHDTNWQCETWSDWPTLCFGGFFCFFSATCESSRNLHCRRQEAATSGRRKLCVSARLAPVAPCLWGTSWGSERMNWVSGTMNDEKPTAVMLPLNLALSLFPPPLCFVLPLYIRVSDSYVLTYLLKSLRGFTRAQKGLLISNDGCQNYGKFMAWSRLFVYLSRVHTLTSWCGIFHLVI